MIRLPPEITFEKRPLPGGGWAYDFRHRTLGALGRILLLDRPGGCRTHVSCEVAGDPADPRTAERRMIFEPLALALHGRWKRLPVAIRGRSYRDHT